MWIRTGFRINAERNFSFCARLQVSRKERAIRKINLQGTRVRERFAQISPLLPPLRQTFEYCVSQIRYIFFPVLYIESRNQLHEQLIDSRNDRPAGKLPQIGGSNTVC